MAPAGGLLKVAVMVMAFRRRGVSAIDASLGGNAAEVRDMRVADIWLVGV